MYYIYMLRCEDNSIYTGITVDLENRMREHFFKEKNGAKYTKSHKAKKVEKVWKAENKSLASKLEYHVKKLTKKQKEELIQKNKLKDLLGEKIDYKEYKLVKNIENITQI